MIIRYARRQGSLAARVVSLVLLTALSFQSFAAGYAFTPVQGKYSKIHGRRITVMPFGDSITAGVTGSYSYRYFLWKLLQAAGYTDNLDFVGTMHGVYDGGDGANPDFDQDHEGHPAWNTSNMRISLPEWIRSYSPDIVLMHMGTNDIGEGFHPSYSKTTITAMIDTLRNRNPLVVIMLARIIPAQVGTAEYPAFNDMIAGVAAQKSTAQSPVVLIDQNSGFELLGGDYSDGVHLSTQGEQKMAARWFEALVPVLNGMGVKPLEIKPGSGELLNTGHFDITLTLNSFVNKPTMNYEMTVDGIPRQGAGLAGTVRNLDGTVCARTFRMKDVVPKYNLGGPGRHVFTFGLRFTDSTMVRDTVIWNIIDNRESQ